MYARHTHLHAVPCKKILLGWFTGTGEGPPRLGDALGGSLTGDQGSLAEETIPPATPPQGSS